MESDDGYEPQADEIVTVGYVNIALSRIVVAELEAAGIRADAVEQRGGYGGPIKTRILCFAQDQDAAVAIIDRIFAESAEPISGEPDPN